MASILSTKKNGKLVELEIKVSKSEFESLKGRTENIIIVPENNKAKLAKLKKDDAYLIISEDMS
jgi:hypothetical protein